MYTPIVGMPLSVLFFVLTVGAGTTTTLRPHNIAISFFRCTALTLYLDGLGSKGIMVMGCLPSVPEWR